MSDKLSNQRNTEIKVTSKPAMIKDLNEAYSDKEHYWQARNAVNVSSDGNRGTIQNESATEFVFEAPYKIIGAITLPEENKYLIFSTDDISSEIGIGDDLLNTYETVINSKCLNFNSSYPIRGVAKTTFSRETTITFTDKYNPVRRATFKELRNLTNCNDILLWKKITIPKIEVEKDNSGILPNGSYSVAIAYSIDSQRYSEYYSITNRIHLFSEVDDFNSLKVTISDLDLEFETYQLILLANIKGTKTPYIQGEYSTKQNVVNISDLGKEQIPLADLVLKNSSWQKAGIITANSKYLMLADLESRGEENYQLKALDIDSEYVIMQVPADWYKKEGRDFGYYRDETYQFQIEGIYNTGESTLSYHIPGPLPTASDLSLASGQDVYEYDESYSECDKPEKVFNYMVRNTAGGITYTNNPFVCNKREFGYGKMGYSPSTDLYPNNKELFGKFANKQILNHRFPNEEIIPRYSFIDGQYYINILGIRFKNIPKFDSPDIVGYRITRSDRNGNRTVISRGLITNVREYADDQNKQSVMFSNYPFNDLSPDEFISEKQTVFKNKKENNFVPVSKYYKDRFNFYSPHNYFFEKYRMGNELKIECEEVGQVVGNFSEVFNHPKQLLLTQFSFWIAASVGFIQSTLILLGKIDLEGNNAFEAAMDGGPASNSSTSLKIETLQDLISLNPIIVTQQLITSVRALDAGGVASIIKLLKTAMTLIGSLAIKVPYSILSGIQEANKIIQIIQDLTDPINYAYQYNAVSTFNKSIRVEDGNKRRRLLDEGVFIKSALYNINGQTFNNFKRETSVYINLNKEIPDPTTKDTSRDTISGFGLCNSNDKNFTAVGSCYYATSKVQRLNQYGQIGSTSIVKVSDAFYDETSPVLFGGDCAIVKFQVQKRHAFFTQDAANANFPDNIEYDYRLYRNIGYPRFWLDSTKYAFNSLISSNIVNRQRFNRTTASKYNLDCKFKDDNNIFRVDDAYMYTTANGVMEFFVECDYNISFREDTQYPHFSDENRNLSDVFRSDRLLYPEEFKLNRSFADLYTTEVFNQQFRVDYKVEESFPIQQPNTVIYSLPSFNMQNLDNWRYFLPGNIFNFRESDFGILTQIHKLDQDRLIFLMSRSSPFTTNGMDFLEMEQSGRKITVGDGGLFAQDPTEMMPTDNNFGASKSRYAFSNTHLGRYYVSEIQGRILSVSNSIDDISMQGLDQWCKTYIPFNIIKYYPKYKGKENPLKSYGYLTAFDASLGILYITKRDFIPKKEYINDITLINNEFFHSGLKIELNSMYFEDVSWTLSYSIFDKSFISYHDWHPDWTIQTENHFMSVKDNKVWRHNTRNDLFTNYYGKDYPFEVEFIEASGNVGTISSIEYNLEAYRYKENKKDKFHVLNENFDTLVVSNSEQCSPFYSIKLQKSIRDTITYPRKNDIGYDILFTKEEQKYRINQFWDAIKDRGEFTNAEYHIWHYHESGYKKILNMPAIDLDKPRYEKKKFRSNWTKFLFAKAVSGSIKYIVKMFNIKKINSIR